VENHPQGWNATYKGGKVAELPKDWIRKTLPFLPIRTRVLLRITKMNPTRDTITKKANRGKLTSYYIPRPTLHSLDGRYTQKKPILRKKEENL